MCFLFLASFMPLMAFKKYGIISDVNKRDIYYDPVLYTYEESAEAFRRCESTIYPDNRDIVAYYSYCRSKCKFIRVVIGHGVKLIFTNETLFESVIMKFPKGF